MRDIEKRIERLEARSPHVRKASRVHRVIVPIGGDVDQAVAEMIARGGAAADDTFIARVLVRPA